MNIEIFRRIGLTEGETKVYTALLKQGETTTGAICRESRVSKSKVYDILEKLIQKGFVGYIIKNGIKYFAANDPKMILEFLKTKEEELENTIKDAEKILPQLEVQRSVMGTKKTAEIYEGFHGIKAVREEFLLSMKHGDEMLVLGAPKIANEKWEAWFQKFHKSRITRGISLRIIYNSDAKEFGELRKRMRLTEVKYFPNKLVSQKWIDVFSNAVIFVIILKNPIVFVVRDKSLADSFRAYFDIMWKAAKK